MSSNGRPTRFGRGHKAMALVPLAVLSAAWTASIATTGTASTVLADAGNEPVVLPDGTNLPAEAIEVPASVSAAGGVAPGIGGADATRVVSTVSTSGIPAAALAAYQRAETVINSADNACHLTWQLVAAIGRVESDHGRTGGNALDAEGVARPGIFGPALDGKAGTTKIVDSDAGQFDSDTAWDRAVGPMQFIPSTWSVVGVDADSDGRRDPQDIDDAALASAVYLCSGDDDLATTAGQRAAVFRYNHSEKYVDLVLSIMDAYLEGEFTSVPNGVTSAGYVVPQAPAGNNHQGNGGKGNSNNDNGGTGNQGGGNGPSTPASTPTATPTSGANPGGQQTQAPSAPTPTKTPQLPAGVPTLTLPPLPSTSITPVDQLLSDVQARAQCLLDGYVDNILRSDDPFDQCVYAYTH
jgi:transglycosylase-like protein with SLT domain